MQPAVLICNHGIFSFRYWEDASDFVKDLGLEWNTLVDNRQLGWVQPWKTLLWRDTP